MIKSYAVNCRRRFKILAFGYLGSILVALIGNPKYSDVISLNLMQLTAIGDLGTW